MMFDVVLFLLSTLILLKYSFDDLKKSRIENDIILLFYIITFFFAYQKGQLLSVVIVGILMFIIFFWLWTKKFFGGADMKIFPVVIMVMVLNGQNIVADIIMYFMILSSLSLIYGFIALQLLKKKKIPFMPLITLTYFMMSLYQFLSQ